MTVFSATLSGCAKSAAGRFQYVISARQSSANGSVVITFTRVSLPDEGKTVQDLYHPSVTFVVNGRTGSHIAASLLTQLPPRLRDMWRNILPKWVEFVHQMATELDRLP